MEPCTGHGGGGIGHRQGAVGGLHDLAAGVKKLGHDARAMVMDCVGQAAETGNAVIIGAHEHMAGVTGGIVDTRDLADDKPDAALGPRGVIGDECIAYVTVMRENSVVAGRDDPVANLDTAQLERLHEAGGCRRGGAGVIWRCHPARLTRGVRKLEAPAADVPAEGGQGTENYWENFATQGPPVKQVCACSSCSAVGSAKPSPPQGPRVTRNSPSVFRARNAR